MSLKSPSTHAGTSYLQVPSTDLTLRREQTFETSSSGYRTNGSPQGTTINGPGAPRQNDPHRPNLRPIEQELGYNFAGFPIFHWNDAAVQSVFDLEFFGGAIPWDQLQAYKGPDDNPQIRFHDAHFHPMNYTGEGHKISHLVKASIELGIGKFVLMAIPTTMVSTLNDEQSYVVYKGKSGHCGEPYYVPWEMRHRTDLDDKMLHEIQKKIQLRPNPAVDYELTTKVKEAVQTGEILPEHLDKMDIGMTGSVHLGDRRVVKDMLRSLNNVAIKNRDLHEAMARQGVQMDPQHRLRFTHVGESTLVKEIVDKLFVGHQANLKKNITPAREAMRLAGIVGMPFVLHCDVDEPESLKNWRQKNKPPIHIDDIKNLMRSCPNTEIVWAHAGGLGRFVKEGQYHLEELEKLMQDPSLNHVKLDISWSVVAEQIGRDPRATTAWAQFMVNHQDRILFGSDSLTPNTNEKWTETYDIYNQPGGLFQTINAIDPTGGLALQKIRINNYDRVFTAARERIDCFTDYVIPEVIEGILNHNGPENINLQDLHRERDRIYRKHSNPDGPNFDPRVARTLDHYRRRDERELPYVGPDKERKNQVLKGAVNRLTAGKTMKAYKPYTGRAGDFAGNKLRRQETTALREFMNRLERHAETTEEKNRFTKIYQTMARAEYQLNTNLVPDPLLREARAEMVRLQAAVFARKNVAVQLPPNTVLDDVMPGGT